MITSALVGISTHWLSNRSRTMATTCRRVYGWNCSWDLVGDAHRGRVAQPSPDGQDPSMRYPKEL